MIRGVVTENHEGIVRLSIFGRQNQTERIEAVVDTGYDGWLSLPQSLIHDLELPWLTHGRAVLADGSECVFNVHEGEVLWDRRRILIEVDASETMPLVGMQLLEGFELTMKVRQDGPVLIKRMKPPSKDPRRRR
jgi:clan AA aspartic protease